MRQAASRGPSGDTATAAVVDERIGQLEQAIAHWQALDRATAEARLFPLAQLMVTVDRLDPCE